MGRPADRLEPEQLLAHFQNLPHPGRILVALSGGADSTALLHMLAGLRKQLNSPLAAIHVNHGVHPDANHWQAHCQQLCDALDVPLIVRILKTTLPNTGGPEATLRAGRYQAFEAELRSGDCLCTAHHEEDQAETVLLNLFRGSGVTGLAGMPRERPLGKGLLLRPLLKWPQARLSEHLRTHGITWLEDPSNQDINLDRNRLRQELIPALRTRWPGADSSIARSAEHCREAHELLAVYAAESLEPRQMARGVLNIDELAGEDAKLKLILRLWLRRMAVAPLPYQQLRELCAQLAAAKADSRVSMAWQGHSLRYYNNRLWLDSHEAPAIGNQSWSNQTGLTLGPLSGTLSLVHAATAKAVVRPPWQHPLEISSRNAGDSYRTNAHSPTQTLKSWFLSRKVPVWLRDGVPVLRENNRVVAIGGSVVDGSLAEVLAQQQLYICWQPADPHLRLVCQECMTNGQQVK